MGDVRLTGMDSTVWEEGGKPDLIAVKARSYDEALSHWITGTGLEWYQKLVGKHYKKVSECLKLPRVRVTDFM
jgi:hypothetical protein